MMSWGQQLTVVVLQSERFVQYASVTSVLQKGEMNDSLLGSVQICYDYVRICCHDNYQFHGSYVLFLLCYANLFV